MRYGRIGESVSPEFDTLKWITRSSYQYHASYYQIPQDITSITIILQ